MFECLVPRDWKCLGRMRSILVGGGVSLGVSLRFQKSVAVPVPLSVPFSLYPSQPADQDIKISLTASAPSLSVFHHDGHGLTL